MSRIGKLPIPIASGATVKVNGKQVSVQGKLGTLTYTHRPEVTVTVNDEDKQVEVKRRDDSRTARAMHGLTRALIANMIKGVTEGYKIDLEITGVGWNAQVQGKKVNLNVGFADTRVVPIPDGVSVEVQGGTKLSVTGTDKQQVGQCAAQIRSHRKPEPYNAKGIKYSDEVVARKEGKAFASGG